MNIASSSDIRSKAKFDVAIAAEGARAAELRAQAARHAALERTARNDARTQCHKLRDTLSHDLLRTGPWLLATLRWPNAGIGGVNDRCHWRDGNVPERHLNVLREAQSE
ncbi:hypothetical protein EVAR_21823_1 [Eumeta japonica]|uniref:Uncharacterized protein n=1 Tax=Eumeta variegata TaxID=151549 RepID=A0A4C1V7T4_EUMVA|nr:hypothetical protein EVAR_21823_1 [Eumeta japonica]